jgi:hypothetical protein
VPQDHAPTLEDLKKIVETNYQIIWQYRFAYRELVVLLRQDGELRAGFLAVRHRGYDGFNQLIRAFSDAGVIHLPDDPQAISELQEICWLISEFWLTNLEVNGRSVDKDAMQQGVKIMLRVRNPILYNEIQCQQKPIVSLLVCLALGCGADHIPYACQSYPRLP